VGTVPAEQEPVNLLSSVCAKTPAAGRALGISHWYVAARALVEIPYDSMTGGMIFLLKDEFIEIHTYHCGKLCPLRISLD
jgi:hypothetical protein